jgi:hypothetical protein
MGIFTKLVKNIAGAQNEAISPQKGSLSGLLGDKKGKADNSENCTDYT